MFFYVFSWSPNARPVEHGNPFAVWVCAVEIMFLFRNSTVKCFWWLDGGLNVWTCLHLKFHRRSKICYHNSPGGNSSNSIRTATELHCHSELEPQGAWAAALFSPPTNRLFKLPRSGAGVPCCCAWWRHCHIWRCTKTSASSGWPRKRWERSIVVPSTAARTVLWLGSGAPKNLKP